MKKNYFKKSLSLIMTVLMLMSCWVFVAPTEAEAATLEAASSLYNKSLLNGINTNVDYNVNTTGNYYKFKIYGDGDDGGSNTTARQQKYYKNLLSHDGGTSLVGDNNRGSYFSNVTNSELTVSIAYPTMVLKYDGQTTPKFGIMLEADSAKKKTVRFERAWMDANSNGLSFNPNYWLGIANDDSAYFYCMDDADHKYTLRAQDVNQGGVFNARKDGQWEFLAASLEFTGSMSIGEWTRAISPTWKFSNGSTTYTGTNTSTIYVMNFKGYGELLTRINNHKADLLNNAGQYTTDSIKQYVDAAKAITNLNPKNYTGIDSAVSWGNQMNTAYANYNTAVDNLKKREYEVTYDNMFSLADWRYSKSLGDANYVSVNLNEGKVTITNPNTSEFTTPMSGSSSNANTRDTSFYSMPVVGGQEYTFKYTTDGANTEMFAFFYDKNGGCTHESSYGAYCFTVNKGTGQATFKAPDNSTQMEIRFDNNINGTANFWDIMIYPAAVKTKLEVDSWTARPHRQIYSYNASVGTLQTPVRPGYIFGGWKEDTDGDGIGDAAAPTGAITSTRVLYSTWTPGTMDVGYDNIFSLSKWANSNSSVASNTNRGSIAYDLDAGTITAITTKDGEVYSNYGSAAGHYQMAVKPNTEYIFVADVDLEGSGNQGQMFVFFYDAAGNGVTGAIQNGNTLTSPHIGNYVSTEGLNYIAFTTPANCTKMSVRFGATVVPTTAVYSNIGLYEKAAYDAYAKDYAKVREPFIIGDTDTLMIPTRAGYVFEGWELEDGTKITTVSGLTSNTTVYAIWTKEHTVTYYYGDNTTVLATVKVKDGATVGTLPTVTPTKETTAEYSYTFKSWKANDVAFTASTTVTSDLKVYPVFDNVPHTFVWAANPYKNATCDAPALVGKSCSGCGYSLGNVPYDGDNTNWLAKGHDYSRGEILANSSTGNTDNDTHSIKCARYSTCGSVQLVKHTWTGDTSVGATCTTPGTVKKTCPCGAEKFVDGEIDANAHSFDYTVGTPNGDNKTHTVNCTYNPAHKESVACKDDDNNCYCDICNQELIHVYDEKTKTFEASKADCYNDATYYLTCQCGKQGTETWTDEGSKLKHNWTDTEEYLKSEADCENNEVYYKECSLCNVSSKDITGATWKKADTATGHDYTGEIRNNNNGTHSYLCKNDCGTYGYNKVKDAATDCTYGEWDTTGVDNHVKTCSACGYKLIGEHSFSAWVSTDLNKKADGQHSKECSVCKKVVTEDCTYTKESFAETCTTDGYTVHTCNECNHKYTTADKGKTGHNYTGAVKSYNNGQHSFLCKNGCNTYGFDGMTNACTTCTYEYKNNKAGEHQATCTACNYSFAEECSGGQASCTNLKVCEKCNTAYGTTDPHSFTGTVVKLDGDKHAYLCEYCSTEDLYGVGAEKDATEACSGGTATCKDLAVCDKCNDTYGDYAAHVFNGAAVKLDGDVHAYRCSVCKDNALYGVGSEVNATEACSGGTATCTALAVCTVCNDTHGELDAVAHKWGAWANVEGTETHKRICEYNNAHTETEDCFSPDIVVIAPDCETPGYTLNTCAICAHEWHTAPTEALGHDWSAWVNNNDGTHTRTCKDETCKYGENGGAKVEKASCTEENADAVVTEPTCTEGGYTTYTCKDCGYVWEADATDATGHSYTEKTKKTDSKYQRSTKDCVTDWTYWYCCDNCDVSAETEKDKYANEADLYWVREAAAGHKFDAKTATDDYLATAATCTAKATYYYSCSVCGTSSKDTADEKTFEHGTALNHDWTDTETFKKSDADCINNEVYYKECSRCHISSENETGATWEKADTKSGHDFNYEGGYTAGVAATCTEEGVVEHFTCQICKKHFKADQTTEIAADKLTIAALKHDYKDIAAKAATCEEDGYTKHKQCQREGCGYRNTDYEVIPAKGHEFKAENGYYCDTVCGYHAYKCSNCDEYGVDKVKYSAEYDGLDWIVVGGIECTFTGEYVNYEADGIHSHKLTCVCGNEQSGVCADAEPEHIAPTCTADGYYKHTCDVCSYEWIVASDAEEDKATEHDLDVKSNGNGTHSVYCKNNCGYAEEAEKCSTTTPATNCGDYDICDICKTAFGEAKPHVFTNYVSNNDATCTEDGTKTAICDTCTGEEKATHTIADKGTQLGHDMSEYVYSTDGWTNIPEDFNEVIVAPTCHSEGNAISFCSRCDYYKTKTVKADPTSHVWEKDATSEDGLKWTTVGGNCATGVTMVNRCTTEGCNAKQTKTLEVEHDWQIVYIQAAGCTVHGYINFKCDVCGFTGRLEGGKTEFGGVDYSDKNIVAAGAHDWEKIDGVTNDYAVLDGKIVYVDGDGNVVHVEKYPEYNAAGRGKMYCKKCNHIEEVAIDAMGNKTHDENGNLVHKHPEYATINADGTISYKSTLKTVAEVKSTCTVGGHKAYEECTRCSFSEYMVDRDSYYTEPLGHNDNNGDGKCDTCKTTIREDESKNCGCICHKESGFMKFIYKILKFFWKLFKMNPVCACGHEHY